MMERRWSRGLGLRVAATVAILTGGLVWIILYLAFWAMQYPWYQNVAVVLASLLAAPAAVVIIWVFWGLGQARSRHGSWPYTES